MIGSDVNPDRNGRASPVVVRVYELKSLAAFNSADFFSIYDKESETLGPDLNGKEELRLKPGRNGAHQPSAQTGHEIRCGLAAFRDLDKSRWRSALEVPPKKKKLEPLHRDSRQNGQRHRSAMTGTFPQADELQALEVRQA
jgi:type VI secretion system protein VasD